MQNDQKEGADVLKNIIVQTGRTNGKVIFAKVIKMAIEALEEQPERPEQPESAKEYCAECDHIEMCRWYPYEGCEFRSLPPAQDRPEPVKWVRDEFGSWCSACGSYAYRDKFGKPWESDFCPNCGKKMEVER